MKTGPRTEASRAVLDYIRAHQPVPQQTLVEHFTERAHAEGTTPGAWLYKRMGNLRESGWVQHGPGGWTAATAEQMAARTTAHQERARRVVQPKKAACTGSIAQPRRIDMFGPIYVPPAPVLRAGAMDYAAAPSVINGRPVGYRRAW